MSEEFDFTQNRNESNLSAHAQSVHSVTVIMNELVCDVIIDVTSL